MSCLGNHSWYLFENIEKKVIHCCHGNQFMIECWAKGHDGREEKWHFSYDFELVYVFELRLEIRISKLPHTANFSLIHPKTKKQWRLSTSVVVATSKWRVWRHTFELNIMSSNFFKMSQDSYPSYILTNWPESEKILTKPASLIMFLAKHSPTNWSPWQQ